MPKRQEEFSLKLTADDFRILLYALGYADGMAEERKHPLSESLRPLVAEIARQFRAAEDAKQERNA